MTDTIDHETGEVTTTTLPATDKFREQFTRMDKEIAAALPPHVPVERFMRVVLTAVNGNPDLAIADRRSLFEAAMKAAQDGLLPDGRDGAFVIFNTKIKREGKDVWIKKVQWMPMVGGILKKVRNSGELLTVAAHVVYTKDKFFYCLGDEEKIDHVPTIEEDRGSPMLVYAVAKTKDGGIYREVMTLREVQKVRNVSKAKDNGPWVDWWDEMARKTVIKRLAKRLPTSADLDDLLRQDDDLYDFSGKRAELPAGFEDVARPAGVKNPLADEPDKPAAAATVAEKTQPQKATQQAKEAQGEAAGAAATDTAANADKPKADAQAAAKGPETPEQYRALATATIGAATDAGELERWWKKDRSTRIALKLPSEVLEPLQELYETTLGALRGTGAA